MVLGFTLGHTYDHGHVLKEHTLVVNSFGELGPELLRFLWAIADYAAHNGVIIIMDLLQ